MKRMCLLLLVLAVLLCGCAGEGERAQPSEEAVSSDVITVRNVDELLAALGPDRVIRMELGTYNLSWASDFGRETESEYYRWEEVSDGYELKLVGLQNVTIRGSGREETQLLIGPRFANVLVLQNCTDVILEDFTAGHVEGGECAGGVVNLLGCMDVELNRLGLFGCGTVGLQTDLCTDIALTGCEIYDCSSSGIWTSRTDGFTVENCVLRNLGSQGQGGSAMWLSSTSEVLVSGCEIRDCQVMYLISAEPKQGVQVRDTVFLKNRVYEAVFDLYSGGMVLDNCSFEGNTMGNWFSMAGTTLIDGIGKTWDEDMLRLHYEKVEPEENPGEQVRVTVSNVDELLAAIAPDTEIILKDGIYDLSTAADYGTGYSDYYYWMEEFDGPVLTVDNVSNLTIRSESGDVDKCLVSAVPRYANVFNFRRCTNLKVSGFTAGHTLEPGECMGGVLDFERCAQVQVENCGLFGCGILGIQARMTSDMLVRGCDIYECSYGGIQMADMVGVTIEGCTFRDLGGDPLYFYNCEEVTVDGEKINAYEYYG